MHWIFDAIGTTWVIDAQLPEQVSEMSLQTSIRERIADFDVVYSRFRADSLVSTIARSPGTYTFPADAEKLFSFYRQLYDVTEGAVTPLIGQTLVDAGYDATYSLTPKSQLHKPQAWSEVMLWRAPKLMTQAPVLLDVGAAGKGYLIDIVSEILEAEGISTYCVDAGGDMRQRGQQPLAVGLENPLNTAEVIGVVALENMSLCGSAGNRRAWDKYHHTINPQTLTSPEDILATWVIANDTMTADGLATALYFCSPQELLVVAPFAYCYVTKNGELIRSPNFPAQVFGVDYPKPGK
jgi:FAD:protein FMN transferase